MCIEMKKEGGSYKWNVFHGLMLTKLSAILLETFKYLHQIGHIPQYFNQIVIYAIENIAEDILDPQKIDLNIKIILQIIISVVWWTNFLSEIRRHKYPRWWGLKSYSERDRDMKHLRMFLFIDDRSSFCKRGWMSGTFSEWC